MIVETRKCDGCGEKIEPANSDILPDTHAQRRSHLVAAKTMFTRVTLGLQADILYSHGIDHAQHGNLTVDVCATCAETRTIASFRVPPPQI